MSSERIVILAGDVADATLLYSKLSPQFTIAKVVVETPTSRRRVLRRRMKKLGLVTAFGQALFVGLVPPVLRRLARRRITLLEGQFDSCTTIPNDLLVRVDSINDQAAVSAITAADPSRVVVYGTRLLGRELLNAIAVPIINIHLGITPQYRGGNGGYWALASSDREHCGVTVHLIDEGIDTGGVLAQGVIEPTADDSFVTYPLLQLQVGIDLLIDVLKRAQLTPLPATDASSGMWYHPTLWGYLWRRWRYGVK